MLNKVTAKYTSENCIQISHAVSEISKQAKIIVFMFYYIDKHHQLIDSYILKTGISYNNVLEIDDRI